MNNLIPDMNLIDYTPPCNKGIEAGCLGHDVNLGDQTHPLNIQGRLGDCSLATRIMWMNDVLKQQDLSRSGTHVPGVYYLHTDSVKILNDRHLVSARKNSDKVKMQGYSAFTKTRVDWMKPCGLIMPILFVADTPIGVDWTNRLVVSWITVGGANK